MKMIDRTWEAPNGTEEVLKAIAKVYASTRKGRHGGPTTLEIDAVRAAVVEYRRYTVNAYLEKLHRARAITIESRADLNQIRIGMGYRWHAEKGVVKEQS